jgi:DNA invertase Pin-like site-specific DNA recombinase
MEKLGYARVSTQDQRLDLQRQALTAAGCSVILEDQTSGRQVKRPGLDKALTKLGPGVVLVVWRLDRLGRSLSHLVAVLRLIEAKGAGFVSLTENIDTTSAGGRLVFHMMGALAEFERSLIVERTQAGLAAAKARGAKLGRRRLLSAQQVSHGRALLEAGESGEAVAASLGVSRATLYRALVEKDISRLKRNGLEDMSDRTSKLRNEG